MTKVVDCLSDLQARVQLVVGLEQKTLICYNPDDLVDSLKAVPPPAVGVAYLGTQAAGEPGQARQGKAGIASFGLYLFIGTPVPGLSAPPPAMEFLDLMRQQIIESTAPAGHRWRFVSESLADSSKGKAIWVQRWDTPVILGVGQ